MEIVSKLFGIARTSNRLKVLSTGNPERILKYFVNKNIFKFTSRFFLKTRRKGKK